MVVDENDDSISEFRVAILGVVVAVVPNVVRVTWGIVVLLVLLIVRVWERDTLRNVDRNDVTT